MNWLLLILSLPTDTGATRMRAWRALKACGAGMLRDGVHILPAGETHAQDLTAIADDVQKAGGHAYMLTAQGVPPLDDDSLRRLFDRTAEYAELVRAIDVCPLDEPGIRLAKKLGKTLAEIIDIDFFPGEAQAQARARLNALQTELAARRSPDEPKQRATALPPLQVADYQGRTWATRRRPWVDRLASAWLIHRHIDPAARILWLAHPDECPSDALGFDFDGATFSHSEAGSATRVTFETLLDAFALEHDPALRRLGQLVHYLDVGGLPVAEAPGLEAMLAGLKHSLSDDDALLAAAQHIFDAFYVTFGDPAHD